MGRYAIITPARNEAANLPRVAESLVRQSVLPFRWIVVDNGSTDGTGDCVRALSRAHPWIELLTIPGHGPPRRGAASVRAFQAGVAALLGHADFIVNHDADISVPRGYFEFLLAEFERNPRLGIASGTCFERQDGVWRQRFVTGATVWGGSRMYRRECLDQIQPLEERLGWDGMDEAKAHGMDWETELFSDLPFFHHRPEGKRDGSALGTRVAQWRSAYYMGYRPWYLALRSLRHCGRNLSGLGMLWGYMRGALDRDFAPDPRIREHVRRQQRISRLADRFRETTGRAVGRRRRTSDARI